MISIQELNVAEAKPSTLPWRGDEVRANRFQVLQARLHCGIVVVGLGGNVLFANDAAAQMFQCSPQDLVGRLWGFSLVLGGISEITLPQCKDGKSPIEMQVTYTHWDGGKPAYVVSLRNVSALSQGQSFIAGEYHAG